MSATIEHALADESALQPGGGRAPICIQEIIRQHHSSLISFLRRRLGVGDDADDLAQETYIRMMKYEGSREVNSPAAMLFTIATNVANDHGRAAQVRRAGAQCDIEDVQLVSEEPSAERFVAADQSLDRVLDVIEALPPKCKRVFLLSRAHGMTYAEIAEHCGISVKMVEKQISRALAACLREVGGIDGNPS